jgi:hypothetical protein
MAQDSFELFYHTSDFIPISVRPLPLPGSTASVLVFFGTPVRNWTLARLASMITDKVL